jgi:hypothetical protein
MEVEKLRGRDAVERRKPFSDFCRERGRAPTAVPVEGATQAPLIECAIGEEETFMIRAKLWFRCAAMHDPVTPIVAQPALVGWEAKKRRIDLTIERAFSGEELVKRMKGWVTADPYKVIEVVKQHGRLKVLDDRELVVEFESEVEAEKLQETLAGTFGGEVDIELVKKR